MWSPDYEAFLIFLNHSEPDGVFTVFLNRIVVSAVFSFLLLL